MGRHRQRCRDEHVAAISLREPVSSHCLCSLSCFAKPVQHTGAVTHAASFSQKDLTCVLCGSGSLPVLCVQKDLVKNC